LVSYKTHGATENAVASQWRGPFLFFYTHATVCYRSLTAHGLLRPVHPSPDTHHRLMLACVRPPVRACVCVQVESPIYLWAMTQAFSLHFLSEHIAPFNAESRTIHFSRFAGPGEAIVVWISWQLLHQVARWLAREQS